MPGSLILGPYDLLDPTSPAFLAGSTAVSTDFGSGPPDTSAVERLLTDGEVVTGTRTRNRTLTLPIVVKGSRTVQGQTIAAIAAAVNQSYWQITWTPDAGLPTVVFDCFRGQVVQGMSPLRTPDLLMAREGVRLLTVSIPALPFTRDLNPTSLAPQAPTGGLTVSTMDSMSGLLPADPAGTAGISGYDTPAAVLSVDSSSHVAGTGSVQVGAFVQERQVTYEYTVPGYTTNQNGVITSHPPSEGYATVTYWAAVPAVTIPLGSATDYTDQQTLSFYARSDFPYVAQTPTQAVDGADSDPVGAQNSGTWVATLIDSTGKRSSSTVQSPIGSGWARVLVPLTGSSVTADSGFDVTHVTDVRIRYWAELNTSGTGTAATPELMASASPGSPAYVSTTANTTVNGQQLTVNSAGDAAGSWNQVAPVTAGSVYALAGTVNGPAGSYRLDMEWLNSSAAVISTTTGTVRTGSGVCTATGTAPTGAVTVRPRITALAAAANTFVQLSSPHVCAGSTAWQFPYGTAQTVNLWLDNVQAEPAGGGLQLSGPYSMQTFTGIGGSARTPVSMAVNVTSGTAQRLLIARTPDPQPNFNPFLTTPTGSPTSTADSAALTGKRYSLGSPGVTYQIPALSVGGTYGVLARVKANNNSTAMTPAVTASLTGSSTSQTISRTYAAGSLSWTAYSLITLGALTLPPQAVGGANTSATVSLTVTDATGGANGVALDMLILVDLAGEQVLVDLPSGVGYEWFWLTAPGPGDYEGSVLAGTVADGSDAISVAPWLSGAPVINFDPGSNAVTVLLDQATSGGTVNVQYFRKWPGEAGSS